MKLTPEPIHEPPTVENGFMLFLQLHRGGGALAELSERLAQVVAAVHATGKPGAIVLKIGIKCASRGVNAVVIADSIDDKTPQEEAEASFWFATSEGRLQRTDPRQTEMPFSTVRGGKSPDPENETDNLNRAAKAH